MKNKVNACPLCNSKNTFLYTLAYDSHGGDIYSKKRQFEYYKCMRCDLLFLKNTKINSKYFLRYYNKSYRSDKSLGGFLSNMIVRYSNYNKIKLIKHYFDNNKVVKVLDVGCGNGEFIKRLPSYYSASGLEIDKNLVKQAVTNKLDVFHGKFNNYKFNSKYDCICMWHVIEHIENPRNLFNKIHKLLNKNGIFVFSTPNVNSIGFWLAKDDWFHLDAPRHLNLFSDKTIKICCDKYNFKMIKLKNNWHDFPMDLWVSLRNYNLKFLIYLFYPFVKFFDKETLTYVIVKK